MKLVIVLIFLLVFVGCDKREYLSQMDPAYALKRADKNPNPVFDGVVEPPIPSMDEIEDEKNLLGPDRNNNGIRDDIDIWINRTGKNYNERMALRQYAGHLQDFTRGAVEGKDDDAEKLLSRLLQDEPCLWVMFPGGELFKNASDVLEKMDKMSLYPFSSTKQITFANFKSHVGRTTFHFPKTRRDTLTYCIFKIENEEEVYRNHLKINKLKE